MTNDKALFAPQVPETLAAIPGRVHMAAEMAKPRTPYEQYLERKRKAALAMKERIRRARDAAAK